MTKKAITFRETGRSVAFNNIDLPMLIHGESGEGASLLSILIIANFVLKGEKVLFFTAFPMARKELLSQLASSGKKENIFDIQSEADIPKLNGQQVAIIKSGDVGLCLKSIQKISDIEDRVIFIKNIETVLTEEVFREIEEYSKTILSGDLNKLAFKEKLDSSSFVSKILFSKPDVDFGVVLPKLGKYEAYLSGREDGAMALVNL